MDNSTNNIISEEELKDKLVLIYDNAKLGKMTFSQIQEKYGISQYAISDLKSMSEKEFDEFLELIPDIIRNLQERKRSPKIAAEIGCGTSIISFIGIHTCDEYTRTRNYKEPEHAILRKKIEMCWKEHKLGETIEALSVKYNMDYIELEKLLTGFNSSVEKKRKIYKNMMGSKVVQEKSKKLKETWELDDDTIAYIVEGKEIERVKGEKGASLDEP